MDRRQQSNDPRRIGTSGESPGGFVAFCRLVGERCHRLAQPGPIFQILGYGPAVAPMPKCLVGLGHGVAGPSNGFWIDRIGPGLFLGLMRMKIDANERMIRSIAGFDRQSICPIRAQKDAMGRASRRLQDRLLLLVIIVRRSPLPPATQCQPQPSQPRPRENLPRFARPSKSFGQPRRPARRPCLNCATAGQPVVLILRH